MNNRKMDIDKMFAQLREEATPTPLRKLIEPRPSGALFALKKSLSMSLLSTKTLWLGIGCVCGALAVAGGVLYNTLHTAQPQKTHAAPAAMQQTLAETPTQTPAAPHGMPTEVQAHTVRTAAHVSEEAAGARAKAEKMSAPGAHTRMSHTGSAGKAGKASSSQALSTEDDLSSAQAAEPDGAAITSMSYRSASYGIVMEPAAAMESASLPAPPEEFPLSNEIGESHNVSLTMDGLALLADIVQVQSEARFSDRLSGGILLGVGNVSGSSAAVSHTLFLAGAQIHYYLLGDFEGGLQVGAEALFSSTHTGVQNTFLYKGGRTLSLLPYAGYKLVLASGLTMNLQAGVGAMTPVFIPATTENFDNTQYKWRVSTRMQMSIGWSL